MSLAELRVNGQQPRLVNHPSGLVIGIWAHIEPMIGRGLERSAGDLEPIDILRLALDGKMQIWTIMQEEKTLAVGVSEVKVFPQRRVAFIVALAGEEADSWLGLEDEFVMWAHKQGCTKIRFVGRGGWKKHLSEKWKATGTTFERDV